MTLPGEPSVSLNDALQAELAVIVDATQALWRSMDNGHLFIAGGTGFIGCWWLEAIRYVNQRGLARILATVLSRDVEGFKRRFPHLGHCEQFTFIAGGIDAFIFPRAHFTHIIHAATEPSHRYLAEPSALFDTVLDGTRRMLELARLNDGARMLYLSSGAVYGQQPPSLEKFPENWRGGPKCNNPAEAYGEAKRCAEMMCATYASRYGFPVVIARVFSLLGPYMPLQEQFAAGNFLHDALSGRAVIVAGDGTPIRSYLYAGDVLIWLLHLLLEGQSGEAYNIGSEVQVSIAELASLVANVVGTGECIIQRAGRAEAPASRYLPDTSLMRRQFGVSESVDLATAIRSAAAWWRIRGLPASS